MSRHESTERERILILCTGNSVRSQMAEGLLRELAGDRLEVCSAGVAPWKVHRLTIQVMAERGIDISQQRSKSVDEFADESIDEVITVCDDAALECPEWVGNVRRTHWSIRDPLFVEGSEAERCEAFRRTRDLLEERLAEWLEERGIETADAPALPIR